MDDYFSPTMLASLKANPSVKSRPMFDLLTRIIDLIVAGVCLLACTPLLAVVALVVKMDDGGPVFFRQQRLGKGGTPFSIIKFRTMVPNAEQIGARLTMAKNDPRITRVGRILRESRFDELPQLFNVIRGEMSLVGPRPALVFQKDYYESWEMPRLAVIPGITGLAQVSGGNVLDWDQRIVLDVYYVRHRSVALYVAILARTMQTMFFRRGLYNCDGKVQGWTRPVPEWYQRGHTSTSESM